MKQYVIIFFSLFLLSACDSLQKESTLKFSGTLEWTEHALGAKSSGRLATLAVEEGDVVKKDQVIATLDRFDQARKDYLRIENLYNQGGATEQQKEYAVLAMDDQRVTSPLDGIVLVKVHETGEIVQSGSPVVVIGDPQDIWVKIFVMEKLINTIHIEQPAKINFDGLKQSFNGHVIFISPKAEFTPRNVQTEEERITQTFAVKVKLDNPPPYLRPGVAADIYLEKQN